MGLLTSPVCCAAKCCGCIVLSQLLGLILSVGAIVVFVLVFQLYILPWGEKRIIAELGLPPSTDFHAIDPALIARQNCSGCVFGRNTDWPTKTNGTLHFLDTSAGTTISSVVGTSLVASAAVGAGSMLWASIFPSMASVLSFTGGFYEMTHILEQAQYIGMISQLQLRGAPEFLHQFSKELAWTNFNIPKSVSDAILPTRRLAEFSSVVEPKFQGETGPAKYAQMIGVKPKDLFFYTLMLFGAVIVVIHALYIVWIAIVSCVSKKESFGEIASKWYRKVVWAVILALLLAQYIFAMTGSYYIYENTKSSEPRDSRFAGACVGLAVVIGFAILFGVLVIANNKDELKDIGSYEHDQRPFAAKYSAYYDEYNFDNRFFFVPRIFLALSTGCVVGIIQDPKKQLFVILGVTAIYLVLLIIREPNLLRFLYYIGLTSVFMKIVLLCLMLVLVQDDYFPQFVRDKVAYAIIGINIFIFFLLFLRQAYLIVHKVVRACKNKGKDKDDDDDDYRNRDVENGNDRHYQRLNSGTPDHHDLRGAQAMANPSMRDQQWKQQNLQNGNRSGHGYGEEVVAGGAAAYGANGKNGRGNENDYHGSRQLDGHGSTSAGFGANESHFGRGAAGMYGGQNAGYSAHKERDDQNRLGLSSSNQFGMNDPSVVAAAQKPEPIWRKNMERRAAEAAAAEAVHTQQSKDSFVRFDSNESVSTGTGCGVNNGASYNGTVAAGGLVAGAAIATATAKRNSAEQSSSDEWTKRHSSSELGSSGIAAQFAFDTNSQRQNRVLEFRDSDVDSYPSHREDVANSSFMTADSYSSGLQGTQLEPMVFGDSIVETRPALDRVDTQNIDRVAEGYRRAQNAHGENDLGDEDEEDDIDAVMPTATGINPTSTSGGNMPDEDADAVDIDAMGDDSSSDGEEGRSVDIDVDADDDDDDDEDSARAPVDIDIDDDEDETQSVDIDSDSLPGNDSFLDSEASISIKQVDEIGLGDRASSLTSRQNDSFLSAASSESARGFERGMSQVSSRSDDDFSFYVEGRHDRSPRTQAQHDREVKSGPIKL